jgi:hypothetical protein
MTCREVRELIYLYMDSELDARGTLEVQRHLDTCAVCARNLTSMIEQDRSLREAARTEVVDSSRLRQLIVEEVRKPPRLVFPIVGGISAWKRAAAIAATVVCVSAIVLAVFIFKGRVPKVYADAVDDHVDHCSLDKLGEPTDPELLKSASREYCGVTILPDLSQYGFTDPRGRLCDLAQEQFLHLVYFDSKQQPVSVFISAHSSRDIAGSMKLRELSGYTIASINSSGIDLLVLTTLDQGLTRQIADAIAGQVRQATQASQTGLASPAARRLLVASLGSAPLLDPMIRPLPAW